MTEEARWLDVEIPGGSGCVAKALEKPRAPGMKRFEARFMEDVPNHKFPYSRVIEAPSLESATTLAIAWAKQHDDDFRWIEER